MTRILTEEGIKKLEDELNDRKIAVRQRIAQAIKEAKEQGDLSENAEYSEAKHQQGENETRIAELEAILKEAVVAKRNGRTGTVQMGSRLQVSMGAQKIAFTIVGSNEVDPGAGKISNESPLGQAFLNHVKGDAVTVDTPSGKREYTILEVE